MDLDSSKIYKIEYTINLLTSACPYIDETDDHKLSRNTDIDFIDILKDSEEYEAFR